MKILRKTIVITLAVLCLGSVFSLGWLDDYYYRTRPRQPDSVSGRVIPENVKGVFGGVRVYLTHTETLPYQYFPYLFLIFGTSAALLDWRWKVFRNPHEEMAKKLS